MDETNRIIKNINGQNNENGKASKTMPANSGKMLKNKPAKSGNELLTLYRKYDNIFSKGEVNLCKDYSKKDCLIGKNQE